MEFTGKVAGCKMDIVSGTMQIAFTVNETKKVREQYDGLAKLDKLSIRAVRFREKRSLDANAYFHVLLGKIAEALKISKPRCKNELLHRYGQYMLIGDDELARIESNVPEEQILEMEAPHCYPVGVRLEDDRELTIYQLYRGSHTYTTKEMSVLIEGTVDEAKTLGIETLTPREIEEMERAWKVSS